jgi:hypothetical protein
MAIHHHLKRITEWLFLACIPATGKKQNLKESVWCAQNTGKGENLFIGAVSLKQGCV